MIYFISGFIAILALAGGSLYFITNSAQAPVVQEPVVQQPVTPPPQQTASIVVDSPVPQSVVSGELEIIGKARGTWFFEASFPVNLKDQSGTIVASGIASTADEWMTTNYVPFIATIDLTDIPAGQYLIEFKKDNPSGEPQNDESATMPITVQ